MLAKFDKRVSLQHLTASVYVAYAYVLVKPDLNGRFQSKCNLPTLLRLEWVSSISFKGVKDNQKSNFCKNFRLYASSKKRDAWAKRKQPQSVVVPFTWRIAIQLIIFLAKNTSAIRALYIYWCDTLQYLSRPTTRADKSVRAIYLVL